jgi:hypothetical protein
MRVWDAGSAGAGERLSQVQAVLDELGRTTPADQPVLVRAATDDLGAYFAVAAQIETLPDEDRIALHKAGARMAAGHLRSQIRYHAVKRDVGLDDPSLVSSTRSTNALDFALLVQDLVPLLEAYEQASAGSTSRTPSARACHRIRSCS